MVHIVGWMLVVNQTLTPAENFTVILALCRGNDIVSGVWLAEIRALYQRALCLVPNNK